MKRWTLVALVFALAAAGCSAMGKLFPHTPGEPPHGCCETYGPDVVRATRPPFPSALASDLVLRVPDGYVNADGMLAQPPHYVCDEHSPTSLCPDGPDANIDDSETRMPPGDHCMRREVYDYNAQHSRTGRAPETAHPCDCTMACDNDGARIEQKDCPGFCHKNKRSCTCHEEEPCPGTHAALWRDMDGTVVAVAR